MHNKTLADVFRGSAGELLLKFLQLVSFTLSRLAMRENGKAAARARPDRHRAEFNIQFPPLNGMFGLPAGSRQVEESVQRAHKMAL